MEQKIPVITVHSQSMAGYLMMRKFILIDKRPDLKNEKLNVFIFKDTKEIRIVMSDYSKQKETLNKLLFSSNI